MTTPTACSTVRGESGITVTPDPATGACVVSVDPATLPPAVGVNVNAAITADPAKPGISVTPGTQAGSYVLGLDAASTASPEPSATAVRPAAAPGPIVHTDQWDKVHANIVFTTTFNLVDILGTPDGMHLKITKDGVYFIVVTARVTGAPAAGATWSPQGIGIDVLVNDDGAAGAPQRLTPAEYTVVREGANDTYVYNVRHALGADYTVGVALTHMADPTWQFTENDVHLFVFRVSDVPVG